MKRLVIMGLLASTLLSGAPALAQREGRGEAGWVNGPRPGQSANRGGENRGGDNRGMGERSWSRPAPDARGNAVPAPEQRVAPTVSSTRVPPSDAGRMDWRQRRDTAGQSGPAPQGNWRQPQGRRWSADQSSAPTPSTPPAERQDWNRNRDNDGQRGTWSRNGTDDRQGNWNRDDNRTRNWAGNGERRRDDDRASNDQRNWNNSRDRYDNRDRNDWSRQRDWSAQRRLNDRDRWAGWNRWDNDWRNDRRYDWRDYRAQNRYVYRLPTYYAPYGWSYGYRRFSIGIYLSNVLFASDYWIDDPYDYRLPPAYGPLRWVRYYDDALLVDIRDGYVVDVIHDFFW
jgi:hypothetical protein